MNALPECDYQVAEGKRPRETGQPVLYAKHTKGQTLSPIGRAVVAYAKRELEERISREAKRNLEGLGGNW